MDPKRTEEKQKFQVDRIAFFSDAVFAIAITLMIIEVKPPHIGHAHGNIGAIQALLKIFPMFIGVVLSFIFIGIYWQRHHQLFRYVINYNPKLISLNMVLLLSIIFIPFSTAFNFENPLSETIVPLLFYNLNYIATSVANYLLFQYALNPANGLCVAEVEEDRKHLFKELIFPVFVFVLVSVLAFIIPVYAPLGYAAFGFQGLFLRRKQKA